ncbi:MAG: pilus assembly PilX N-terminal domain-containing protein [Desulfuromonadales bacterium]|nr:pilus assembly PilX N-terminal domain-containing protein [Desulfuromonadales bacterium]MDW7756838.1 pilus assembly PilX N-terminal domain-containing protein [Desulfuromonadales bacterium]
MLKRLQIFKSEKGSVLILALLLMTVLTIIGLFAGNNTTTELRIAGNDRLYKNAFYAAETGLAYVIGSPDMYSNDNTDSATPATMTDVAVGDLSFDAVVTYDGASSGGKSLRGSGYSAGIFRAHSYVIESTGNDTSRVQAMGHRIGF